MKGLWSLWKFDTSHIPAQLDGAVIIRHEHGQQIITTAVGYTIPYPYDSHLYTMNA